MVNRVLVVAGLLILSSNGFAQGSQISYTLAELGGGTWQYTYDVTNNTLAEGIDEFTVWFGIGSYENLTIETLNPPADNWGEIVWQPDALLGDDGGYDALATGLDIGIGETISGFAVSFDWLGAGAPGSQFYEIIDPVTFDTIDSGWTVPEPATMLYLTIGIAIFTAKQKKVISGGL